MSTDIGYSLIPSPLEAMILVYCSCECVFFPSHSSETFVLRMAKGSGINGLASMSPVVTWSAYPSIKVVRPLLQCSKVKWKFLVS